jgi:DNA-binding beta-propeller fold protein YncE
MGDGEFSYPRAVAVGPDGAVYVVDKTARVQRFSGDGKFEVRWRMPEKQKGKPVGLAVHPDGRVFVADTHYGRVMIYDAEGVLLGQFGRDGRGDGEFLLPTDVAFDRSGHIYVAEYGGNDRISKFTPELEFVSAFGHGEGERDGLLRPAGLVFDRQDRLWVADACQHRIRCYDTEGWLLSEFGQLGSEPGQLKYPYDITLLGDETLLVCEYGNNRLQRFSQDGKSVGVWGMAGRSVGELGAPWGVDVAANGLVYVVDSQNNRIQSLKL